MKPLIILNFIVSLVGAAVIARIDNLGALGSFLAGASVGFGNLFVLYFSIKGLMRKKQVALSLGIIVFKYAFLGMIIYVLLRQPWLHPLWFGAGLGTLVISSGLFGFTLLNKQGSESNVI